MNRKGIVFFALSWLIAVILLWSGVKLAAHKAAREASTRGEQIKKNAHITAMMAQSTAMKMITYHDLARSNQISPDALRTFNASLLNELQFHIVKLYTIEDAK